MKGLKLYIPIWLLVSACSNYVEGIDQNPNGFTDISGELLVGQAELEFANMLGGHTSRLAAIFSDQFTGTDFQFINYDHYILTTEDFNEIWNYNYQAGFAHAKLTREKASQSGNTVLEGIAEIYMAGFIGELSLLFGDVPFTEAGDVLMYPAPRYDPQVEVFNDVQLFLSSGISKVGTTYVSDFYGGELHLENEALWGEIGHSLKARYYLAVRDYLRAYEEALSGISSPAGDLLTRHTDTNGGRNEFNQFDKLFTGLITASNSHMYKLVTGVQSRVLNTPGDANRALVYFDNVALNTSEGGYFGPEAPAHLVTWLETRLIEAEAAARIGEDGLTPFNAVRDRLASVYGGSFPHSSASGDALVYEILEEKFISLVGQLSVFSDLRRTKNRLGVAVKSPNAPTIPARFLYPQSEIDANENFPGLEDLFTPTPINQ